MRIKFVIGIAFTLGLALIALGIRANSLDSDNNPASHNEFTDQACLDCHTSEALLRELAVEEEEVETAPSEGPG